MAKTFEIHLTGPNGSVHEREELSVHDLGALETHCSRCHIVLDATSIGALGPNGICLTALKNKVQTLQRDKEILKTNLNKAEEKVKLLSEEKRTLHESNKGLLISEKKHSASNSTKVHDVTTHQTLNTDTVVDIDEEHGGPLANNTNMNNNISGDQAFSKGQEPTELDPKDKGLFNFMKPISLAALGVISPLSFASFALMGSAGYPTISKFYKDYLLISTGVFFLYSLITCGVVHAVEGRPNDIDLAFAMIIAEIAYVFFVLCLDAMIFVGAPWFIIPLSLFLWLVLTGWLVWRFRRPTGLYTLLTEGVLMQVTHEVAG